ncbi:MAG TPA: hypothetical protein VEQ59_17935 [Polyangiaceae bacterium]|nr:hypothetical protein [Polyangiaceae bacterium]
MKKSAISAALLLIGLTMSGCPVYDDDAVGCYDDFDCPGGYQCDVHTGDCYQGTDSSRGCNEPSDCGTNETCSRSGSCVVGDCHFASVGCVRGFECSSESGRWECVEEGSGAANGGAPSTTPTDNGGAPSTTPTDSGGAPEQVGASGASN